MTTTADTHRQARMGELFRLTWAQASGRYARRPGMLRWLAFPFAVMTLGQVAPWISRGELFTTGSGTAVVMTSVDARRRAGALALLVAAAVLLMMIVVIPAALVTLSLFLPLAAGEAVQWVGAAYFAVIIASGLVVTFPIVSERDEKAAIASLKRQRRVVRLHDLVRAPADERGTGVVLLADVIRDPRFTGTAIIATAAHESLARQYVEAGMTRFAPGSLTVTYLA